MPYVHPLFTQTILHFVEKVIGILNDGNIVAELTISICQKQLLPHLRYLILIKSTIGRIM